MSSIIEITRLETSNNGTFGTFAIDKSLVCFTLELPNKQNHQTISSIPTGQYFYETYQSEKFNRMCLKLHNVYNRTYVSIHQGNTVIDTTGCILVGTFIGHLKGKRAVLGSNKALDHIITMISRVGIITIREVY